MLRALTVAVLGLSGVGCARPPTLPAAEPSPATRPPAAEDEQIGPVASQDQPPPGVFHRILRGQTLYTIARTYGAPPGAIAEANDLVDPDRIEAGALLFVPGAERILDVPITVPRIPEVRFLSPAEGPINSRFGRRRGRMHYGLDIGAPAGSAVRAAQPGKVLYAGDGYRGYGKLVILDHGNGFQTLYAHNRRLRTRTGREVRAGDVIAEVGATGNASGPHLHFEIRRGDRPVDPSPYLTPDDGVP